MILSAYRNPPYRSPTPQHRTSLSPPTAPEAKQSPKRKRSDSNGRSAAPGTPLQIVTTRSDDEIPESGANSPRTKVAERLRGLAIHEETPGARTQGQRKRLKRTSGTSEAISTTPQTTPLPSVQPDPNAANPLEIGETPHASISRASPTPSFAKITKRPPSPPPPAPAPKTSLALKPHPDPAEIPLPDENFWQDSEITGHELDPTSPDDDGEGINGIGFKPTPAMAYARSQRRKQQVSEWKAREAREARQRRVERRRGATVAEEGRGRVVRFVEGSS